MALTLSNGKEISLYSTRFIHIYLDFQGQSKELRHFQNGEAFSSQATGATTTMQGDFHSNVDFFESEDQTGQFTFNTTPNSDTTNILGKMLHYQHDSITATPDMNDFFGIKVTNDVTGEVISGEGCRIAGYPNNEGSETAFALAWTILVGYYQDVWLDPTDPMFSDNALGIKPSNA